MILLLSCSIKDHFGRRSAIRFVYVNGINANRGISIRTTFGDLNITLSWLDDINEKVVLAPSCENCTRNVQRRNFPSTTAT